jgi:hypothetical protein
MLEREKVEHEIYQLRQIIRSDVFALASKSTRATDRAGLQRQIEIRSGMCVGLLKQLSGDSSLGAVESRGPHAQAKA